MKTATKQERDFHEDATCGACGGPLDSDRIAICHDCFSEADWWREACRREAEIENAGRCLCEVPGCQPFECPKNTLWREPSRDRT